MNYFRDASQPKATDLYIQPVLPGASYYPQKCDAYFGDPHIACFQNDYIEAMASDLYDVQFYHLYTEYYSIKLRSLAQDLYEKLQLEFGRDTCFISTHLREDNHATSQRIQSLRNIGESDFDKIKAFIESKAADAKIIYLVQGDISKSKFTSLEHEIVQLDEWIKAHVSVEVTPLQLLFVAEDVSSRFRLQIITKVGGF